MLMSITSYLIESSDKASPDTLLPTVIFLAIMIVIFLIIGKCNQNVKKSVRKKCGNWFQK